MRLSISLESDLYAIAKALAKSEDCSLSAAINKLLRRSLEPPRPKPSRRTSGFPVVSGSRPITAEDVAAIDADRS